MDFGFAKAYMPRSLYWRAALILLAPVVALQLVVSVVFIQRHFEGVTVQMTRSIALELGFLRQVAEAAPDPAAAEAALARVAGPLAYDVALPGAPPPADARAWYDFSGRAMIGTLRAEMAGVLAADLTGAGRGVAVWLDSRHGPLEVRFDRRRVSASNPHQLLVLMLVTGVLMTVIAYLFLRNQLRPIRLLARAATEFGRGRIVPYRPSGATEVRAAGSAFLDMRGRIDRHIEQRTMMLSGVSHDMRTPLTRLKLGLSMMEDEAEVRAMQRDLSDLERLLDEFLDFARMDALDDAVACDPAELVAGVVAQYAEAGGDVRLAKVAGSGEVRLRPVAVRRALENLIGNALRYAGRCELRLALSERSLRITVEDDGPGIPEDRREEALKPFARLDAARNQDRGSGVGLGLAIAKDIARRHGGSLTLGQSRRLGGLKVELVLGR
jgi:two-component system osmolarity sensor histidine kinase EnvZ